MADQMRSFEEFWPYYVGEHSRPATRLWHWIGSSLALVVVAAAIWTRHWWLLAVAPVCGYGLAWISHFWLEHNRPATFRHPLWSLRGDCRMWLLMATGRMAKEVQRIGAGKRAGT